MQIQPLQKNMLPEVKKFCDESIGKNYYSMAELEEIFQKSQKNKKICSFVLIDRNDKNDGKSISHKIHGIRFTYPPGNWQKGKGKGLSPEKWQVPIKDVGYFQSLFVSNKLQAKGWGKKLSLASLKVLQDLQTKAVVCHSWRESPGDSSGKYLRSLGFNSVASHPLYWKEVDYECTRCGKPCLCTADEMIKYL